jgi:hypothetical protein
MLCLGVGNKKNSGAVLQRVTSDSRNNNRSEGVANALHVSGGPLNPFNRIVNLFTKDDARRALLDESEEDGPQVSIARKACLLSAE